MSLISRLPTGTFPRIASLGVSAIFNAVSPGLYDFNETFSTLDMPIRNGRVYLIDKLNFTANFSQQDYIESMQQTATLLLKFDRARQPVYARPIQLINYFGNADLTYYFYHDQKDTNLGALVDGTFLQTANMVGQNEFFMRFQFFVYEVSDKNFVDEFRNAKEKSYYLRNG